MGGSALDETCSNTIPGGWEAAYNPAGLGGKASATQHYGVGTAGLGIFSGNSANAANANFGVIGTAGINAGLDGIANMDPTAINRHHPPRRIEHA